ncbi:MAG: allantoate amidohydrolase [Herpetosiphonaceae bacterium]|nr:allantoate amidohydrolase [Herpetosiphonaceae bacterium]
MLADHEAALSVMQRIEELARCSEEADRLTRRYGSLAMRRVNALVATWMRGAGMSVWQDHIGNLRGRYAGSVGATRTLLLGSHLDTVRDAGKYDGPLGVLLALQAIEHMQCASQRLPFAVELLAFADEEGLRFGSTYLGSKVVAGTFDSQILTLTDADGMTLHDAVVAFGGDPSALAADRRAADDLLGYCELHVEQGPVLEAEGLPVGVVVAIAGQSRIAVHFKGTAGHAGTVPMTLRQDAVCAAAEFVLAVEQLGRQTEGLVATVGQMVVDPGASNVIPGHVHLSLDVRHQQDDVREDACRQLQQIAAELCTERGIAFEWQLLQMSSSVACDQQLTEELAQAVVAQGYPVRKLVSGAGHDAVALADLTRIAMLFVRCKAGISHHPAESVTTEDVGVALAILHTFLQQLALTQAGL